MTLSSKYIGLSCGADFGFALWSATTGDGTAVVHGFIESAMSDAIEQKLATLLAEKPKYVAYVSDGTRPAYRAEAVILRVCSSAGIKCGGYSPAIVRSSMVGNAPDRLVDVVRNLWGFPDAIPVDATAIAVARHAWEIDA